MLLARQPRAHLTLGGHVVLLKEFKLVEEHLAHGDNAAWEAKAPILALCYASLPELFDILLVACQRSHGLHIVQRIALGEIDGGWQVELVNVHLLSHKTSAPRLRCLDLDDASVGVEEGVGVPEGVVVGVLDHSVGRAMSLVADEAVEDVDGESTHDGLERIGKRSLEAVDHLPDVAAEHKLHWRLVAQPGDHLGVHADLEQDVEMERRQVVPFVDKEHRLVSAHQLDV